MSTTDSFGNAVDTAKLKGSLGRLSAFSMGLIAGILHGIVGIIVALASLSLYQSTKFFFSNGYESIFIAVAFMNFAGGCLVRKNRISGGIFMMITSILIVLFAWFFMRFTPYAPFALTITGLLSLAASILAFIPYREKYLQKYAEQKQRQSAAKQQSYQPPAAPPIAPDPKDQAPSK